jgi:GNAT superfamily N-acetyltransferase
VDVERPATPEDGPDLARLIALLGHEIDPDLVGDHLETLSSSGIPQLAAAVDSQIVGLCGLHLMTAIHRDRPVGRITILVVDESWRGSGIGKALVAAAVDYFRVEGCELVEVTSNDRLVQAHAFYEKLGFEKTSKRFATRLP